MTTPNQKNDSDNGFGVAGDNSEVDISGFRRRVESLIGDEKPFAWAKRIGLSAGSFNRIWKQGKGPSASNALLIARACGVTTDWLLTGDGPMSLGEIHSAHAFAEMPGLGYQGSGGGIDEVELRQVVADAEKLLPRVKPDAGPEAKAALIAWLYMRRTDPLAGGNRGTSIEEIIDFIDDYKPGGSKSPIKRS